MTKKLRKAIMKRTQLEKINWKTLTEKTLKVYNKQKNCVSKLYEKEKNVL